MGVTLLPHHHHHNEVGPEAEEEDEEAAWAEEQEAARATAATPAATAHMVGAYLQLAQSCQSLRVLSLPRQRCVCTLCMYMWESLIA